MDMSTTMRYIGACFVAFLPVLWLSAAGVSAWEAEDQTIRLLCAGSSLVIVAAYGAKLSRILRQRGNPAFDSVGMSYFKNRKEIRIEWKDITSILISPVYVHVSTHTREDSIRLFGTPSARLACANVILAHLPESVRTMNRVPVISRRICLTSIPFAMVLGSFGWIPCIAFSIWRRTDLTEFGAVGASYLLVAVCFGLLPEPGYWFHLTAFVTFASVLLAQHHLAALGSVECSAFSTVTLAKVMAVLGMGVLIALVLLRQARR